jgi:hypothetical protein
VGILCVEEAPQALGVVEGDVEAVGRRISEGEAAGLRRVLRKLAE